MKKASLAALGLVCLFAPLVSAQRRVDYPNRQERMIAVVPFTGAGSVDDPKRPLFAPSKGDQSKPGEGITGYSYQLSDDGKYAIVEFQARDRSAFELILKDSRVQKALVRGEASKQVIETEMKNYKREFVLNTMFETMLRSLPTGKTEGAK